MFVVIVLLYKILTNTYCFFRIRHLDKQHLLWLSGSNVNFPTYKNEIISLFKKAGIKNVEIPTAQAIGFNRIASFNADIFTNFPSQNPDIIQGAFRMFYEAEGIYRQRIFETISPMYWVDAILFAPKKYFNILVLMKIKPCLKLAISYLPSFGGLLEYSLLSMVEKSISLLPYFLANLISNRDTLIVPFQSPPSAATF